MKKIFINPLNRLIEIKHGILIIKFEDPIIYRLFSFSPLENLTYSEENNIIDLNKYCTIIYNPFDLSLNEKKIITALYHRIIKSFDEEDKTILNNIETNLIKLMDNVYCKNSITFEIEEEIDINKLLSSIGLKYPSIQKENFFDGLLTYLKAHIEFLSSKIFITFNLTSLLSIDEQNILNDFLLSFNSVLIDCYCSYSNNKNDLIVDSEWCSI